MGARALLTDSASPLVTRSQCPLFPDYISPGGADRDRPAGARRLPAERRGPGLRVPGPGEEHLHHPRNPPAGVPTFRLWRRPPGAALLELGIRAQDFKTPS